MTKLLDQALETVRKLPPAEQDEIARAMLTLAPSESEPENIEPAQQTAVTEGLDQAEHRDFSTAAEIEAALRLFEA